MIYLLILIASLNIVLLIEVIVWHCRKQEKEGKIIGYGKTFTIYLVEIIIIGLVIFMLSQYFKIV